MKVDIFGLNNFPPDVAYYDPAYPDKPGAGYDHPDRDWGDYDPNFGGRRGSQPDWSFFDSGGVSISIFMGTHDFIFDDGCIFYCVNWTPTSIIGAGGFGSFGNAGIPVTVSYGLTKHLSIGHSIGFKEVTVNDGVGWPPVPVQVSVRLSCSALTKKSKNGYPCKKLKPVSVFGILLGE